MIVGNVCQTEVVTIGSEETLSVAAHLMREQHVGLLVVVAPAAPNGDRQPIGVLTDRDIVTAALAKDADVRTLKVGDVMTRNPLLADEGHPVEATLRFMRDLGVRRVPVVGSRGQLTGVLSLDDMLDAFASQLTNLTGAIRNEQSRERATR
jgi:CBS domain-containing protein